MSKTWYPVINLTTCSECGRCIALCCHGVYDKTKKIPTVIYSDGCVDGCHGCGNRCPTHSIQYVGDTGTASECNCIEGCGCGC